MTKLPDRTYSERGDGAENAGRGNDGPSIARHEMRDITYFSLLLCYMSDKMSVLAV